MAERAPQVFTISPGVSFADALAAGLLAQTAADPLALSRYTILLPTRRARRAIEEAFLRQSNGRPLLLPGILPLGDLDPDEVILGGDDEPAGVVGGDGAVLVELPPAIPALRRQLLLTQAIQAAGAAGAAPALVDQAARLAAELARLLDQVQTEQVPFGRLRDLVPADYAEHWQITLRFLGILTEVWPGLLAAEGCLDPAERRNQVLAAWAAAWRRQPPAAPVIVAGSTGSVPATAALIQTVAGMPQGCIVLPGLDRTADDATWRAIADDASHPQHGMALLLRRLELTPAAVADWPAAVPGRTPASRARLVAEALRPAATTDSWQRLAAAVMADPGERERFRLALGGITRIDCPGPPEEAQAIALQLRGTLETPGRRAALVTPDRGLARRVAAELARWGITVDDSAGQPLGDTAPGSFLRLTANLLAEQVAPVPLLALLKHPLASGGREPGIFRSLARQLERDVLRGPRPAAGFAGLRSAVGDAPGGRDLLRLVADIERLAAPFAALFAAPLVILGDLLDTHVRFAEGLAASSDETGAARLWAGAAGEAAAGFIAELDEASAGFAKLPGERYPALLDGLLAGQVVRPRHGRHPRLAIWGPLEARLQQADLLILGGLNEGTWPAEPSADPWLSRPMRRAFGLPPAERRIGLAAPDFAQALGAPQVVLTRALRVEGTPTVPSRWLLRLDGLLRALGLSPEALWGGAWLDWGARLDAPGRSVPARPPAPCPPIGLRPRQLSVTQIEVWRRDPYAIYARHILKLRPLEPLDAEPGAAERGTMIHRALERFAAACPGALPADALERLLEIGRESFGAALSRPALWAFWWPRFERIAGWFLEREQERRPGLAALAAEVKGRLTLNGPLGPFLLTATADRIDRRRDGGLAIVDYKTGTLPSPRDIELGLAPQLPLEAAIAAAGGFAGLPAAAIAELAFWRLTGGDPPGEIKPLQGDPQALAEAALDGLRRLIAAFDDPATPYASMPDAQFAPRFSDYAHLARVMEWSAGGGGEE